MSCRSVGLDWRRSECKAAWRDSTGDLAPILACLQVTHSGINIQASTVYGALHALESLTQMAEVQASGKIVIRGEPWYIEGEFSFAASLLCSVTSQHSLAPPSQTGRASSTALF